jgi:hypothetical protein
MTISEEVWKIHEHAVYVHCLPVCGQSAVDLNSVRNFVNITSLNEYDKNNEIILLQNVCSGCLHNHCTAG